MPHSIPTTPSPPQVLDTPTIPDPKPGILLVHCRILPPLPTNIPLFSKWSKLHFRDMLDMSATPASSKITKMSRFAPLGLDVGDIGQNGRGNCDGHKEGGGVVEEEGETGVYVHVCHTADVGVMRSEAFYGVSRRLDLENESGRMLREGEEGVGVGGMVWDICGAEFGVWGLVGNEDGGDQLKTTTKSKPTFQNLPVELPGEHGNTVRQLVALRLTSSATVNTTVREEPTTPEALRTLQLVLEDAFYESADEKVLHFQTYASLYRYGGASVQPEGFPCIVQEEAGREEWLAMFVVDVRIMYGKDEAGKVYSKGDVRKEVQDRVKIAVEKWGATNNLDDGVRMKGWNVWDGELFME